MTIIPGTYTDCGTVLRYVMLTLRYSQAENVVVGESEAEYAVLNASSEYVKRSRTVSTHHTGRPSILYSTTRPRGVCTGGGG